MIKITTASVKVMRSYDYCHFEVVLEMVAVDSPLSGPDEIIPEQVDELRKTAARLADKAVAQYRVAKSSAEKRMNEATERHWLEERVKKTRAMAEGDRTVSQQAELKAFDDAKWESSRQYDYEDQWGNEEP